MLEVPAETPLMVAPLTVATEVLDEAKLPPLKPLGAEAVEVWPVFIVDADNDTEPEGQDTTALCTVTCTKSILDTAPGLSVSLKTL